MPRGGEIFIDTRLASGGAFLPPPDVVMIDGRLRPACAPPALSTKPANDESCLTIMPCARCTTSSKGFVKPATIVGQMAVFHVTPREWPSWADRLAHGAMRTRARPRPTPWTTASFPDIPVSHAPRQNQPEHQPELKLLSDTTLRKISRIAANPKIPWSRLLAAIEPLRGAAIRTKRASSRRCSTKDGLNGDLLGMPGE